MKTLNLVIRAALLTGLGAVAFMGTVAWSFRAHCPAGTAVQPVFALLLDLGSRSQSTELMPQAIIHPSPPSETNVAGHGGRALVVR
jgi:hypothetical protein